MSSTKVAERLAGKTAVVTGASRGIGFAVARGLVAEGARVGMLARGADALRAAAATLGPLAHAIPCDVSDATSVAASISIIRAEFQSAPHIIVNNAGVFPLERAERLDAAVLATTFETNVVGPHRFVREFLGDMRTRGSGHILTIGSVADRQPLLENGAYAASKYAARALHEVMRAETRGSGVRVTLVSPGPVDTPLWDSIDPDHREGFTTRAFMLRPQAVADAVVYAVTQPADVNIDELRLSHS
jgi:NADP-dependent 3-hydroxy acid dehydrogenase YdfG